MELMQNRSAGACCVECLYPEQELWAHKCPRCKKPIHVLCCFKWDTAIDDDEYLCLSCHNNSKSFHTELSSHKTTSPIDCTTPGMLSRVSSLGMSSSTTKEPPSKKTKVNKKLSKKQEQQRRVNQEILITEVEELSKYNYYNDSSSETKIPWNTKTIPKKISFN
jgi:hypothetical protein